MLKKTLLVIFLLIVFMTGCFNRTSLSAREVFKDKQARKLAVAAAKGNTDTIDVLLSEGVDVNSVGEEGVTPLVWAFSKQNKVGFEHLLKRGADPNVRLNKRGDSLLFYAKNTKDLYFLDTALKYGGDPNQRKKSAVGDVALLEDSIDSVSSTPDAIRILIKHGADISEKRGRTTLAKSASMLNRYEIVYILLEAGAEYSADERNFSVAYSLESRGVHPDDPEYVWRNKVVEFLRNKGVAVTPLEWNREDQPTIINVHTSP